MKPRTAQENTFTTHDGQELFYRSWTAVSGSAKGAIVLLHRGHEHSGRLVHLVHELNLPDFAMFAWDARGHGRSPGQRGDSPGIATSVRDVADFVKHVSEAHDFSIEDIVVVGQSVGAVLAAAWAHDYAPRIRGMVLASPAFKVKLYVPFARPALRLGQAVKGNYFVNSYVKAKFLSRDPDRIASYDSDPLIARAISVNMLLGLHDISQRIIENAAALTTPTQLLISGKDRVVHDGPQHRFYERLGAARKERHVFEDLYHDTFGDTDRLPVIDRARAFILECFSNPAELPLLLDEDKRGYSRVRADRLASPLPTFSTKGLYWRTVRHILKVGGWLSKGLRTGQNAGFDSGRMLDYVYENRPQGTTPIGEAIDRAYLNSVGWRGIRQRKAHVEELLQRAMRNLQQDGRPVHILDIAAGHGRYVLDACDTQDHSPDSILLRDYDPTNVENQSRLIEQRGLGSVASSAEGDAFDPESFSSLDPQPTLGVVSGLYELFADNDSIRASLAGLSSAIPDGGYLVYTCQPWHPQVELIARALTSHRHGQAWIMRLRSQAEMDQLVANAGFEKVEQRIDEWGMFTVSLARKTAS